MSEARTRVDRALALVLGGYALCLAVAIAAVVVWDSGLLMGLALAGILGLFAYARRALRCPLCGAAAFLAPVPAAIRFIVQKPRRCPRCRTDFEQATTLIRSTSAGNGQS